MWGKSKGSKKRELRIYFATDLHGSEVCFRKFLAAAKAYQADVIILGGDFAGKAIVPVLTENGVLRARVGGEDVTVPESEWGRLAGDIGRAGLYPVRMQADELDRLAGDEQALDRLFRSEIAAQMHPRVECPELELCDLGPVTMASLGVVPTTPWNTERECTEDELAKHIDAMLEQVPSGQPCILNLHCPPYASGLDDAPELDDTLKPVLRGGRPSIIPVGSHAVRDAIKRYQPVVGLHGHIHESRGVQKIGRTLCVNPGSDYSSGVLRGAVIDLASDGSCLDFLLTTG